MMLSPVTSDETALLYDLLAAADLTVAGLEDGEVRLWIARDDDGAAVGCTGYELSADGRHALIRSVAVAAALRGTGVGTMLATHAMQHAASSGARRAWLFSRRSGPFWRRLGFEPAERDRLSEVLAATWQVRLFVETGQLGRETAWSRPISEDDMSRSGGHVADESDPAVVPARC